MDRAVELIGEFDLIMHVNIEGEYFWIGELCTPQYCFCAREMNG
jgi:hypothetical protein